MISRTFWKRLLVVSVASLCIIGSTAVVRTPQIQGHDRDDDDYRFGPRNKCSRLPNWSQLKSALASAVSVETSGLNLNMWATIVDRDGIVCAVAFSGAGRGSQWPGSRVISAQKANTANSFSLDNGLHDGGQGGVWLKGLALSTANLYAAVQPGGSLFGLQESNPVDTGNAYAGPSSDYGQSDDPLVGKKIGGVNVFGGGLGLYERNPAYPTKTEPILVGGVGLSGDTSCADHNIAWRVRKNLNLDFLSGVSGVSGDATRPDNMVFLPGGGGFGHPTCINYSDPTTLPVVQ